MTAPGPSLPSAGFRSLNPCRAGGSRTRATEPSGGPPDGYRQAASLAAVVTFAVVVSGFAQAPDPVDEAAFTPTVFERPELVLQYQSDISSEELAAHLYLLASDFFEGRATATRGQKMAAHYLAAEYRRLGLEPAGRPAGDGDVLTAYMQPFPVYSERLREAGLTAYIDGEPLAETVFGIDESDGHSWLATGTIPRVSGGLVFAGYGIADAELDYDDFQALKDAGIDYGSSWVMILRDEPLADENTSLFQTADGQPSEWTLQPELKYLSFYRRVRPQGVLVVGDAGPRAKEPFPRVVRDKALMLNDMKDLSVTGDVEPVPFLPIYVVSTDFANRLLARSGRTVDEVQTNIDDSLEPVVFTVPDVTVSSRIERESVELQTENVVALIEGTDPELKDEVVVISSHYDHIGLADGTDGDYVNNGADDDGSGTVAALEIAEAFQKARKDGYGPRRSILFINFSGEEQGLLGSKYFTDTNPLVPLENVVTVLNMDMIGRVDPTYPGGTEDYVYVIGSRLISEELHDIAESVNALTGRNLTLDERFNSRSDPNRFYARSDHWNFGKHGIPFIFFFTGTHEDYHGPGDEPHKIHYDRLEAISQLIFAAAWQVANQDERPAVSGRGFR